MNDPKRAQLNTQRILAVVDSIPRGRVATYGQVAQEAGLTRRARLVGRVLGQLPSRSTIPWHRVVNAKGEISPRGFDTSAVTRQGSLLEREGVELSRKGRIDLMRFGWRP